MARDSYRRTDHRRFLRRAPNDVKLIGVTYIGPMIGVDMFYSATAFSLKKGTYFGIPIIQTPEVAKAHEKVVSEILNSIAAISDGNSE
jgi:hypothetical protein